MALQGCLLQFLSFTSPVTSHLFPGLLQAIERERECTWQDTREDRSTKSLIVSGFEPQPPVWQACTLSIALSPLSWFSEASSFNSDRWQPRSKDCVRSVPIEHSINPANVCQQSIWFLFVWLEQRQCKSMSESKGSPLVLELGQAPRKVSVPSLLTYPDIIFIHPL